MKGPAIFMSVSIEPITREDIDDVLALMREFAVFEKLERYFEVTNARLDAAMFGGGGFVEGLIAREDGTPVGYALFYPSFASFRGQRGMFLEDIYVRQGSRGSCLGLAMLKRIASVAAARGFERIDLQVLDRNTPAIEFYKRRGAVGDNDSRHFKFTDEAFRTLGGTDDQRPGK
jgi:GNAT superfamily N-acetyltransferase